MFLMMEEKQLDFNRPLLSVRRPTQTAEAESNKMILPPSPPVFKSDIKSGPVRNPGTVPFQWEHQPGKPKDERKPSDSQGIVKQHFVPKLPPGRIRNGSDNNVSSWDAKSYSSRYDDGDDTYMDANDTLSRSESFFFNCSNVSGLDSCGILVEPFGSLKSDRQTQDLMMGRFLPAAKALTLETPPHLVRKPLTKPEEPLKEMMKKGKQNAYRFRHSPEEEDGGGNTMASGVFGLVPQFCLRSSLGILNPVPSVRMQAQQRAVSVRRMRSKYQDLDQDKVIVNEDKKLKPNESLRTEISKNFGELLASDDNTLESSSETLVAEKTLYIDTIHSVDKKVQEESKEQSLLKDGASEEAISQMSVDKECPQDCNQAIVAPPGLNVVEITKEKIDLELQSQRRTANLESSRIHHPSSSYHIVPPPPLPKAPSDSWLKRTLPTIPAKNNSFTWLTSFDTDHHQFSMNQANPKWETMVKTSNTQQGFVHFPKETLNPIPEA